MAGKGEEEEEKEMIKLPWQSGDASDCKPEEIGSTPIGNSNLISRRSFLRGLGIGLAVAATPKLIFDMGANLWKPEYQGLTIEKIQKALNYAYLRGQKPNLILCSYAQYEKLVKHINMILTIPFDGYGFSTLRITAPLGSVRILPDKFINEKSIYMIDETTFSVGNWIRREDLV